MVIYKIVLGGVSGSLGIGPFGREGAFNVDGFEEVPYSFEGMFETDSQLVDEWILLSFGIPNIKELLGSGRSIIGRHSLYQMWNL